ncbi:retrovirus-related pol polyprotein from transposon TNT 1-94, partial [Tanacetum coccineum]
KDETPQVIEKFIVKTQRALNATVRFVRTDNGTEFVNKTLDGWFESVGISHETSVPRSPQQNGVVERRNRTLMEAARTMLIFAKAPLFLWAEAVATAFISEGAPAVTESLLPHQIPLPDTSDSDVETLFDHVDSNVFDTYDAPEADSVASSSNSVNIDVTSKNQLPHVQKWTQAHPLENIIGDKDRPVSTRKQLETDALWCFFNEFLTHVEPKTYKQALEHSCWIEAMQEEIHESKGRTVADSIAERLTRPTAYKFKTDCSIIPVWVF